MTDAAWRVPTDSRAREFLNKVPEITVYFWVIKVLCTTVGETAADFLNVNLNLDYFKLIVPCGISDKPVTSLQQEMAQNSPAMGRKMPSLDDLAQQVARNFGRVFEAQTLWLESLDALLSSSLMSDYDTTPANQDTPARAPEGIRELGGEKDIFLA